MNLDTLLNIVPKIIKTKNGDVTLVCRWSKSEDQWIVGYGVQNTIRARNNCGHGKDLLVALVELSKKNATKS